MAKQVGERKDEPLDMEKELSCSICTDILYQPLTLLDCLHSFCGSCVKEWFTWQAAAAVQKGCNVAYTCPSCRDSVRGSKADWRVATLLEGFLKAHPNLIKSEEEKNELRQQYTPGEDVLHRVEVPDHDSEDERREQAPRRTLAEIDPAFARRELARIEHERRRAERARRGLDGGGRPFSQIDPGRVHNVQLTDARLREHNSATGDHHVEHQPSLRSLLSASPIELHGVEQEILQSIFAEGLLDGLDIDRLTAEQEEDLTERIAQAYLRRQRRTDRRGSVEQNNEGSPSQQSALPTTHDHIQQSADLDAPPTQSSQDRPRPPSPGPHLILPAHHEARTHRRSTSATSQHSARSANHSGGHARVATATRSATDLSEGPSTDATEQQRRRRVSSSTPRTTTDPQSRDVRDQIHQMRVSTDSGLEVPGPSTAPAQPLEALQRQPEQADDAVLSLTTPTVPSETPHGVRPVASRADVVPEPATALSDLPAPISKAPMPPSVTCDRCGNPDIQFDVHYNCLWCRSGTFNICRSCYHEGRGCNHWYGFGYMAYERWRRSAPPTGYPPGHERPHVLISRRYVRTRAEETPPAVIPGRAAAKERELQEGAFCESCFAFANECYWHCQNCLEGAWGFCNTCVHTGKHCTHPLLPVAHLNTLTHNDPTKTAFIQLPHLRQDSYVMVPESTACDNCQRAIPPANTRFHCFQCSNGDYDLCTECYQGMISAGQIGPGDGVIGWRRCLQGHRMAIIGYQNVPAASEQRVTVAEPVGGLRLKDDGGAVAARQRGPPQNRPASLRCLALWSYWPAEGVTDELTFPKNAEIREVEALNSDWYVGAYAGRVGLFPSGYVKRLR